MAGVKNGKIRDKGMNVVRQRLRRLGRTTGARTRSAVSDCVVRTVLFVPDPLKTLVLLNNVCRTIEEETK